ncbi:MAG: hypothetical protein FK734_20020 [Asgard group archaeon]|nr:hypothetical protein [Asgard group archaeon]
MIILKIPRLSVRDGTFSDILWTRFNERYGISRAKKIVANLSRPVKEFSVRVTTTKISREHILDQFDNLGWKTKAHQQLFEMITIETKGPFSVPYLKKSPRIIVDKIAAENVYQGSNLFTVGIKRMPKFSVDDIVSIVSPMNQIVAIGKSAIDSKTEKGPGIGVYKIKSFYDVPSLRNLGFLENGDAYSQSIPAAYVAHVLDPQPGEKIVDLCAAPGGKSTSAAVISNNKSHILAFDRSKRRLAKLDEAIKKQKLTSIETINADSVEYIKTHTIKADKVIVDPSCSAIGVRPKLYELTNLDDISNTSNYQKSFLWAASKIVRKGGIITYSTCTLEPDENEKVIAYAVNELGLKLVEPNLIMGANGEDTRDGLTLEFMRRFYPDIHDTPGFFVAKLMK